MISITVSRRMSLMLRLARTTAAAVVVAFAAPAAAEATAEGDVTFTKDIAPILQRSCQHCHRPESVAPMSLLT